MYIELIINSVVLLFVNEVDSQVFSIAYIFNSKWLHTVVDEAEEYSDNLLESDFTREQTPPPRCFVNIVPTSFY